MRNPFHFVYLILNIVLWQRLSGLSLIFSTSRYILYFPPIRIDKPLNSETFLANYIESSKILERRSVCRSVNTSLSREYVPTNHCNIYLMRKTKMQGTISFRKYHHLVPLHRSIVSKLCDMVLEAECLYVGQLNITKTNREADFVPEIFN